MSAQPANKDNLADGFIECILSSDVEKRAEIPPLPQPGWQRLSHKNIQAIPQILPVPASWKVSVERSEADKSKGRREVAAGKLDKITPTRNEQRLNFT